jgi:cold shock CspA family protein/ribosome-associated translation inhibitor RaiA
VHGKASKNRAADGLSLSTITTFGIDLPQRLEMGWPKSIGGLPASPFHEQSSAWEWLILINVPTACDWLTALGSRVRDMHIPLDIAYENGLEASPSLQARIEREAAKLEKFSHRITGCHVALVGRSGKRRQGDLFKVRLRLSVPGGTDIVVDRNPEADHAHEDPYVALRDAFNAARRRLQDHARRFSGAVKHHETPPHGRVGRLFPEAGYGFIEAADGREVYFHRNAVVNGDFAKLRAGAEVRFSETEGEKGPQASTVRLVGKSHILDAP